MTLVVYSFSVTLLALALSCSQGGGASSGSSSSANTAQGEPTTVPTASGTKNRGVNKTAAETETAIEAAKKGTDTTTSKNGKYAFKITYPGEYINNINPKITWTKPEGGTKYDVVVATDQGCKVPLLSKQGVIGLKYDTAGLNLVSGKTYYACVYAPISSAGVIEADNSPMKFVVDTTAPSIPQVSALSDSVLMYTTTTYTYSWPASTDDIALLGYTIEIGSGPQKNDVLVETIKDKTKFAFTGEHGKTYYARLYAIDKAHNASPYSNPFETIAFDTKAPPKPQTPSDNGSSTTLTVTFTWPQAADDGLGVASYYLQIGTSANASDTLSSNVGTALTYSFEGTHGVTYYARYKVIDKVGNVSDYSDSSDGILVNIPTPTLTTLSGANEASDLYINASENSSTNVFAELTASNYTSATYTDLFYDASNVTCSSSLSYTNSTPPLINTIGSANGEWATCVKLVNGPHTTYGMSDIVTLDTTLPTFTSVDLAGDAADGYLNATERTATNDLAENLDASGQDHSYYSVIADSATCDSSVTFGDDGVIPTSDTTDIDGDGDYKVCVKLTDDAGNTTAYGTSSTFTVDTAAPSFTSIALDNEAADTYISVADNLLSNDLVSTLTASDYDTAKYKLVSSATTCDVALTYAATVPTNDSADFAGDGDYKVCVELTDNAGNTTAYGASSTITLDLTAPSFTSLALANDATDGYINVSENLTSNDLASTLVGSGYDTATYKLVSSGTTCNAALTYGTMPTSDSTDFSADGTYKVCVALDDNAGNTTAYGSTSNFTLDLTAPSFTSIDLANDATDGYINITENAASNNLATNLQAAGYDTAAYKLITNATTCDSNLTYGAMPTSDSADFSSGDVAYKVCVKLTDNAGNTAAYGGSSSITLDTVAPVFTSIDLANDATDTYINATENAASNDLVTNLTGSGYTSATYKLVSSGTTCDGALTYGGIPTGDSADFAGDGTYKVCVKLLDDAGNPTYNASATITLDITVPSFTSLARANGASDGYVNITEHAASTDLADTLVASGYDTAAYVLVTNATTCDVLLTYGAMPKSDSGDFGADGTYKVCVKLTDNAGNTPAYGASSTFVLDTLAPSFTSLDRLNDATDGYINITEHATSNALAGNITGTGYDTAAYKLATDATTCDGNLTYGAMPGSDSADFAGDGDYKVCVKLSDNAGNTPAYGATSAFTLDITAPTFTSVDLANDATDGYINNTEHSGSTDLVTNLQASGQDSTGYALTTSGTACDGGLTYGAIPKSDSADFGGDATYKVCVKLADNAGNPTYGSSSSIVLDTAAPVFTSIGLANNASDGYINATEHAASSDLASNLVASGQDSTGYKLVTSATTCDVALTYGASIPKDDSADFGADDSYKVCVKLADNAGNTAYGASSAFVFDTTYPVFTSLSLANDAADGYINATESANNNDLANNLTGSGYTSSVYKLVTTATTCDGNLTFGAMPKSSSTDFTGQGTFKVCVKLTDDAGNITYNASSNIVYDTQSEAALDGLSITTHSSSTNGAIDVSLDFPAAHNYDHIHIRRDSGTSAPADCSAGTLVQNVTNFATDPLVVTDSSLTPDSVYSYRICIYDAAGNPTSSDTQTSIKASKVHTVFVTSTAVDGDLSGAGGADSLCQTAGNTIDNTVTWVALVSSSLDARAVPIMGRVYNFAGTPVQLAAGHTTFWDGTLDAAIEFDETATSAGSVAVWTGSSSVGEISSGKTCSSFASNGAGVSGKTGLADSTTGTAWANADTTCNNTARLYCVNRIMHKLTAVSAVNPGAGADGDISVTVDFPATTTFYSSLVVRRVAGSTAPDASCADGGDTVVKTYVAFSDDTFTDATGVAAGTFSYRFCTYDADGLVASQAITGVRAYGLTHKVFATSATYAANAIDLVSADAACDALGDANVSSKTWVALLSTSTTDASGRVTITGKIENTQGDIVATSDADLWDGTLGNAIKYTETGAALNATDYVWTGTGSNGTAAANYCSDWTDNTNGTNGQYAVPTATDSTWIDNGSQTCDQSYRLYCISSTAY